MIPSKDAAAAFLEDWITRVQTYGILFLLVGDADRLKDFGEEWTCTETRQDQLPTVRGQPDPAKDGGIGLQPPPYDPPVLGLG